MLIYTKARPDGFTWREEIDKGSNLNIIGNNEVSPDPNFIIY